MQMSSEKIIYQYKLLRKIRQIPFVSFLYIGIIPIVLLIVSMFGGMNDLFGAILILAGWQVIYFGVSLALLYREKESPYASRYGWLAGWCWFGYLPHSSVPFRHFRNIQLHLLLIGLLVGASGFVWLSSEMAFTLIILHLWGIAPRLLLIALFQPRAASGSIISLTPKEASLYAP